MITIESQDYDEIIETAEWLEDSGHHSRYRVGDDDECVWVDNNTCEVDEDY